MKIISSSRGLFVIAFVILVATNIVVLSGVASNRSGTQEALIMLTENELRLPYRVHEENSGLALRLAWRALGKNTKLSIESIHVPLKHRQVFDAILAKDKSRQNEFVSPRYKIELAYGSRLEPWLVSVRYMSDTSG